MTHLKPTKSIVFFLFFSTRIPKQAQELPGSCRQSSFKLLVAKTFPKQKKKIIILKCIFAAKEKKYSLDWIWDEGLGPELRSCQQGSDKHPPILGSQAGKNEAVAPLWRPRWGKPYGSIFLWALLPPPLPITPWPPSFTSETFLEQILPQQSFPECHSSKSSQRLWLMGFWNMLSFW